MTEKRHGKGLLFIVTLVLAAGVIKYADIPFAQTVREKAASALSGAANADHVLAVFGGSAMPADTVPAESSGGADDILDRDQTLFPDTVDQTVYPMEFEHATPTSGTLTSSFGSRLSPITGQPGFHYGLDLAADEGTPITAFADGTVRETGESGYGLYVIVDLADGRFTRLLNGIAGVSVLVLLAGGVLLWKSGFGGWLLLVGIMITGSAFRRMRRPRRTACNPHAHA